MSNCTDTSTSAEGTETSLAKTAAIGSIVLLWCALELTIWGIGYAAEWPVIDLLINHGIVCLAFIAIWFILQQHTASARTGRFDAISALLLISFGPIGALGVFFLALKLWLYGHSSPNPASWYKQLEIAPDQDRASELFQSIINGRERVQTDPKLKKFSQIMRDGTVDEKQRLLGVIALKYHPSFYPFLSAALNDPEGSVRVQAAAVTTKLRADRKMQMEQLLSEPTKLGKKDARKQIADLHELAASKLLSHDQIARIDIAIQNIWRQVSEEKIVGQDAELERIVNESVERSRRTGFEPGQIQNRSDTLHEETPRAKRSNSGTVSMEHHNVPF
ncbi:MAG: hypothetical protein HWE23_03130 [Rhodobacteraceae bacterium]|nr:hypothetical protein [Paracoccaceae bacterium]